jgi:hypothetical protein
MALSAEEWIETICPELSGSPSLQRFLGMAVEATSRRFYGPMYHKAVALRAAYEFTRMNGSGGGVFGILKELGGGAPVASASEGKVSVSFAQPGVSDTNDLGSNKFGRMLLGLMKSRPTLGITTGGGFFL